MPENSAPTDNELVAYSLRERAFFGNLVERYEARLDRYITRLGVRDPDDRADVLQEIFIKVYRNLNSFDQSLSFSAWIYRIAHNEAISWYRKLQSRPEGYLVSEGDDIVKLIAADTESPETIFDQTVSNELLLRALEQLDDKYREVLILRYFEHLEYEDISDVLQVPTGTVGTLVHRAKKQLKQKLEPLNI
ncbi:sigma-70 family RNA polymerase sigma factor [Candidatus Nomurabacteria bacterium]|nr:sigma-70 family RNA polymerase sigma factor [Candidatus Nomurabacteria bacterium]